MLKIPLSCLEKIKKQSEEGYPFEICGFLIGKNNYVENIREVSEIFQVENRNKERAKDRFDISPKDYMNVEEYADSKGFQIVGIYHSHPDHPDIPSKTDLMYALEDLSYIIVSVKRGVADNYRSWYLKDGEFEEEQVELI